MAARSAKVRIELSSRPATIGGIIHGGTTLGCMYREQSEAEAEAVVQAAVDAGITYFDTAPLYGAGLSEERLGRYLPRDGPIRISTKCGRRVFGSRARRDEEYGAEASAALEEESPTVYKVDAFRDTSECSIVYDTTPSGVEKAYDESCSRLRIPAERRGGKWSIESYRLHDAETEERFADVLANDTVGAMQRLAAAGKVKSISLGCNRPDFLARFVEHFPRGTFGSIMVAGDWNLLNQEGLELFALCAEKGVRVHNAGVFGAGALWGGGNYRYERAGREVLGRVRKWTELCGEFGFSLPQAAMQFAFLPDVVEHVAVGMSSAAEVAANAALCHPEGSPDEPRLVPAELWWRAQRAGLLRSEIDLSALKS